MLLLFAIKLLTTVAVGADKDIVDGTYSRQTSPNEDGYLKNHLYHRVVIDRTSIERGVHCSNRSILNYEKIVSKINR